MRNKLLLGSTLLVVVVGLVILAWQVTQIGTKNTPTQSTSEATLGVNSSLGIRTKETNCVVHEGLQDLECTPGAVIAGVTKNQVCVTGYASSVRNVSEKTKNQVYLQYGISSHTTGEYEVDHLVSLELGGSNDIANLWPEPADPRPGFHEKDKVENYLHDQVCMGKVSLQKAQELIVSNWYQVYQCLPNCQF